MFIPLCLFQDSCFILKVFCVFTLIILPRLLITMMCCTCLSFICPLVYLSKNFPRFCVTASFSSISVSSLLFTTVTRYVIQYIFKTCFGFFMLCGFLEFIAQRLDSYLDSKLQVCEFCQSSADLFSSCQFALSLPQVWLKYVWRSSAQFAGGNVLSHYILV